ncbi:MAG: TnpV protein [Ruminococcaceae bacterium]|nr:TnpV protein [Oscillospiraceae bacterium]
MQTIFESMGGTYRQEGDYLLPNIEVPESPQIGVWGRRRLQHLRSNKRVLYTTMLMSGTLKEHLEGIDKSAEKMFERLTMQTKLHEGITEDLKANNQLEWVRQMNSIRSRAEEIVYKELIYA